MICHLSYTVVDITRYIRPLQNAPFAFHELEQNQTFFKGLYISTIWTT